MSYEKLEISGRPYITAVLYYNQGTKYYSVSIGFSVQIVEVQIFYDKNFRLEMNFPSQSIMDVVNFLKVWRRRLTSG